MGLCESFIALGAAKTLKTVAVFSKSLALNLAIVARHCGISLSSTASLPDNEFAGSSQLRLWWIHALISVSALIGAFLLLSNITASGCSFQDKNKLSCKTASGSCIVTNMIDGVENKNQAAAELGKLGGQKTAERGPEYYAKIQAKRQTRAGGRPKLPPRAEYTAPLKIGGMELECAVLEDGSRIISETRFMEVMGMYRSGALSVRRKDASAPIPLFLAHKNLKPFAEKHLGSVHFEMKPYRNDRGNSGMAIPGEALPKICEIWMDAHKAGVLGSRQKQIAEKAEILLRGFAQVGIVALIDEATGYQYKRARTALEEILDRFIAKEFRKWAKRFPDDFYKEMFRLWGWQYDEENVKRTPLAGKLTKDLVYNRLAPGVREELEKKNPKDIKGRRKRKHHQWLTEDVGDPRLREHLASVITLMRACDSKDVFMTMINRSLPRYLPAPLFEAAERQQALVQM